MKSFSSLPLSKSMIDNLESLNYNEMTPIQESSIPVILNGKDVLAQAKTGSGKTAAYGIGMFHTLDTKRYRVQALVLCPTRELAEQVTNELRRIAKFEHNLKLVTLTGGMPMYKQEHSLSHEAHVVIGTPGRVDKLLERGALVPDDIRMVVIDEADHMLDMGFIDQVESILAYMPVERQTLCFSATFPDEIMKFSRTFLREANEIKVDSKHDATAIKQEFYKVSSEDKISATLALLNKHKPDSTLIFCNTKDQCREVERELNGAGLHAISLHGDLEQRERTVALIRFANGSSKVLVATDVAARGLDIDDLGAVINYDLPFESETYVHRVGRTGRAGKEGMAFSFMTPGEDFRITGINSLLKRDFNATVLDLDLDIRDVKFDPPMVTLSINGGRKQKISAGDILGALTAGKKVSGKDIGKIDRLDNLTFVAVKRSVAKDALKILDGQAIKGRKFLARKND